MLGNKIEMLIQEDLVAHNVDDFRRDISHREDFLEDADVLTVDIAGAQNIDSVGISFLLGMYRKMYLEGKEFYITGASEDIMKLFQLMKLDEILEVE